MSDIKLIKKIRERTGIALKDIQKVVKEMPNLAEEKIIEKLREKGVLKQQAREGREASTGAIFAYNHENRIGVVVKIQSETDFVSRSKEVQEFGDDLTLHIAAYQPKFIKPEDASQDFVDKEIEIIKKQLRKENKPEEVVEKIIEGKKNKILSQSSLYTQNFIKEPEITVGDKITQLCQSTGENILISDFKILKVS